MTQENVSAIRVPPTCGRASGGPRARLRCAKTCQISTQQETSEVESAVVALICFQCAFAWILTECTIFRLVSCLFPPRSHLKIPDAFQQWFLDTIATVGSKSQSCSSDLCLDGKFPVKLVALPSSCAYSFQASALKALQRVCELFRPALCFRRVQQAGLCNLFVSLVLSSLRVDTAFWSEIVCVGLAISSGCVWSTLGQSHKAPRTHGREARSVQSELCLVQAARPHHGELVTQKSGLWKTDLASSILQGHFDFHCSALPRSCR